MPPKSHGFRTSGQSEDSGFESRAGFWWPVGPTVRRLTTDVVTYYLLQFCCFHSCSFSSWNMSNLRFCGQFTLTTMVPFVT